MIITKNNLTFHNISSPPTILVLDHRGDVKTPCCLGSAKSDDVQPQCQSCGMSNYSSLLSKGISL